MMPFLPSPLLLISPLPYMIWCQVFMAGVFKEGGRSCFFSGGLLIMSGDIFDGPHWVGVVCCWHPAGRSQGCCLTSDSAEDTPHSKDSPAQYASCAEVENPGYWNVPEISGGMGGPVQGEQDEGVLILRKAVGRETEEKGLF